MAAEYETLQMRELAPDVAEPCAEDAEEVDAMTSIPTQDFWLVSTQRPARATVTARTWAFD